MVDGAKFCKKQVMAMKEIVLAASICVLAGPSYADMYDYGFQYANTAAAIVDGEAQGVYNPALPNPFPLDHVLPGLKCWRPSQDVPITNPSPPPANLMTHTYLAGYYVLVSAQSSEPNAAFLADPNLAFALDRTAHAAGGAFVVKNNIGGVISDLACSPWFADPAPYPMGGFN